MQVLYIKFNSQETRDLTFHAVLRRHFHKSSSRDEILSLHKRCVKNNLIFAHIRASCLRSSLTCRSCFHADCGHLHFTLSMSMAVIGSSSWMATPPADWQQVCWWSFQSCREKTNWSVILFTYFWYQIVFHPNEVLIIRACTQPSQRRKSVLNDQTCYVWSYSYFG